MSSQIKHAINKCLEVIEPSLQYLYGNNYSEAINEMSDRMNKMRNDIAHANLDFKIEPKQLADLQLIEILVYAMRINSLTMDIKLKQQALSGLFDT